MRSVGLLPSGGTGLPFPCCFLVLSKKCEFVGDVSDFLPVALLISGRGKQDGVTTRFVQYCGILYTQLGTGDCGISNGYLAASAHIERSLSCSCCSML